MGNAFTSTILPRINFTIFNVKMPEKKGAAKAKAAPSHPPYSKMITDAIVAEGGRKGVSLIAISKAIESKNKVGARHSTSLKLAMKRMLESGALVKPKGVGLAGSFKLAKPEKKPAAVKKPAAKKSPAKNPAAKKPAAKKAVKKPAKKVTKKPAVKKASPKKPAKKAVKKSPKKPTKKTVKAGKKK